MPGRAFAGCVRPGSLSSACPNNRNSDGYAPACSDSDPDRNKRAHSDIQTDRNPCTYRNSKCSRADVPCCEHIYLIILLD